jgi:hypothetical protein
LYWDDYQDATTTLTRSYRINERIGDRRNPDRSMRDLAVNRPVFRYRDAAAEQRALPALEPP